MRTFHVQILFLREPSGSHVRRPWDSFCSRPGRSTTVKVLYCQFLWRRCLQYTEAVSVPVGGERTKPAAQWAAPLTPLAGDTREHLHKVFFLLHVVKLAVCGITAGAPASHPSEASNLDCKAPAFFCNSDA